MLPNAPYGAKRRLQFFLFVWAFWRLRWGGGFVAMVIRGCGRFDAGGFYGIFPVVCRLLSGQTDCSTVGFTGRHAHLASKGRDCSDGNGDDDIGRGPVAAGGVVTTGLVAGGCNAGCCQRGCADCHLAWPSRGKAV